MKTFSQFLNEIFTIRGEEPKPLPPEEESTGRRKLSKRKLLAILGLFGPIIGKAIDNQLNPTPNRENISVVTPMVTPTERTTNEQFKRRSKKMV